MLKKIAVLSYFIDIIRSFLNICASNSIVLKIYYCNRLIIRVWAIRQLYIQVPWTGSFLYCKLNNFLVNAFKFFNIELVFIIKSKLEKVILKELYLVFSYFIVSYTISFQIVLNNLIIANPVYNRKLSDAKHYLYRRSWR